MSKLVKETENALHTLVLEAIGKATAAGELPAAQMPPFNVEIPQDRANRSEERRVGKECRSGWWRCR